MSPAPDLEEVIRRRSRPVNKRREIIHRLSVVYKIPKTTVQNIIDDYLEMLAHRLIQVGSCEIKGIGAVTIRDQERRHYSIDGKHWWVKRKKIKLRPMAAVKEYIQQSRVRIPYDEYLAQKQQEEKP